MLSCVKKPQEFDVSGEELNCGGRSCARCHKCRDWHFTGNQATWNWLCNYKNWQQKDKNRWLNDRIEKLFEKRDGATCHHSVVYFSDSSYDSLFDHYLSHGGLDHYGGHYSGYHHDYQECWFGM
ncbi:unnamed protein product [Rotaria sordida]|uniref:Uncharacterized protein n=1 Tax=Rotaria sordida TaxID=392033 RepID=A0A815U1W3_9BILA|nr:unnamed protein product [Rotaria sordida]CAF1511689.1 unnamed protein product [Rotaria sordida]